MSAMDHQTPPADTCPLMPSPALEKAIEDMVESGFGELQEEPSSLEVPVEDRYAFSWW
jgi:hypothetical protein